MNGTKRVLVALLAALGFGLAGCGRGSASSAVASLGRTTLTSAASSAVTSGRSRYEQAVAYVNCMRGHGITDEPNPESNGNIDIKALHPGPNSDLDPTNTRYAAADNTCQHLLPNDGRISPNELQATQAMALHWSLCMRAHGIQDFPEPGSDGLISVHAIISAGIDASSPRFKVASHACARFQPGGVHLPGGVGPA